MGEFIDGAVVMAEVVVALFFLRFWRNTRDGLHAAFSIAFALLATLRVLQMLLSIASEHAHFLYLIRMVAYLVILSAIVGKNRRGSRERS